MVDYTRLSLAEVATELRDIAREAGTRFPHLDAHQLNWRADATQWSAAQCLDHLLVASRLMLQSATDALDGTRSPTIWQRIPFLPSRFGPMLIRSQAPGGTRKFKAPSAARPTISTIPPDIVDRFLEQHLAAAEWIAATDEQRATRVVMASPFIRAITYSVLDGLRLIVAHDRRHLQQALRVTAIHNRDAPPATNHAAR